MAAKTSNDDADFTDGAIGYINLDWSINYRGFKRQNYTKILSATFTVAFRFGNIHLMLNYMYLNINQAMFNRTSMLQHIT